MSSPRVPSVVCAAVVVLAGLAVPASASAAPATRAVQSTAASQSAPDGYVDPRYASSTTLELQGTLKVAEVEDLGRTPSSKQAYAVTTGDGTVLPVTLTKELPANGEFTGEVVVRGELAKSLASDGLLPRSGSTIDGDSEAGQAAVATAEEQGTPLPVAQATVIEPGETSQTVTPSAHRAYVLKMTDQGSVDGTTAEIEAKVDAMLAYWTTESDGAITSFARQGAILDFDSAGDPPPAQSCGMQNPFPLWNDAASKFPGVNFNNPGNHLIVLVGEECGLAGPVGVATVGSTGLASGGPSILTFDTETFAATGAHELGHNFGLQHANLDTCPQAGICEYWDLYSPMALSLDSPPVWLPTALGTLYRTELGLTTPSEVTTVASPSAALTQAYSLTPRAASSGLRGLLVTDPSTGTTYSVDYRNRTARDASAFYANPQGYAFQDPYPAYPSGVVIERQSGTDATYLMTRTVNGRQTGSFGAGSTFSPSPRLSISVDTTGASASVTVSIAAASAVDSSEPTISGSTTVGETVTAQPGAWTSGTAFTYDWKVDGTSTGATTSTYAIPDTAAGKALTVAVTGSKAGFSPATRTSPASTVAKGTLSSSVPTLDSAPVVDQTVTAVTGTWTAGTSFAYDWKLDGTSTGVATKTYAVPASAAGKSLTVSVTGTRTGYDSLTKTSAGATVAKGTLMAPVPTVSGTVAVDRTVTAETGTWTAGTAFAYLWKVDGASTGVTTKTFDVPASAATKQLTVEVTGSRAGYDPATRTSAPSTVADGTLTAAVPTLSGTPRVGESVSALPGTWTSGTAFSYLWKVDGLSTGVTTTSFDVPASASGKLLTVEVTGSKAGYTSATSTSTATTVAAGTLTTSTPTVSGTVAVGEQVTAQTGTWTSGTVFAYDWKVDGASTGTTTKTFDVPASAVGKPLTVEVTGTKTGYGPVTKSSAPAVVAKGTLTSSVPTLDGAAVVDQTVTAVTGTWTAGTVFAYDWKVDNVSTGVTTKTFDVPASAEGKKLTVSVTGTRAAYDPQTRTSVEMTVAQQALSSSAPTLSGTPTVGQAVSAVTGTWTAGTVFAYDWKVGGASTGVSTATYDVPAAAAGQALTVEVTGTKAGYGSVTRASVAATVAKGALVSSAPTVTGVVKVGRTVSADPGLWTAGTAFAYVWKVDGVSTGVTTKTFDVPASAAGKPLTVVVTGSRAGYDPTTTTSDASTVAAGSLSMQTPAVTGTVVVGGQLTAEPGTWTAGTVFAYDWKVNDVSTGTTTKTFDVPASAEGKSVTVTVTGTLSGYTSADSTSAGATVGKGALVSEVPSIRGDVVVDQTVTAVTGTWTSGTVFAYDWKVNDVSTGVTTETFDVPASAFGKTVTVTVTGTKAGYNASARTSTAAAVAAAASTSSVPTFSVAPKVGLTVTAVTGTWTPGTAFTYDWKVGGLSTGVKTPSFTVPGTAAGKTLTVSVTGTKPGYVTATRSSAASTVAAGTLVGATPKVTGTAKVGQTLKVTRGTWTTGAVLTQQWYANGSAVSKATGTSFKLTTAQRGKTITVKVTGKKTGYTPLAKTSVKTKAVAR